MSQDHDRIDEYLDDLLVELSRRPREARRALVEAEDHLREAAEQAHAAGASLEDAQRAAIERFGTPRLVARRFAQAEDEPSILARWALGAVQVAGVGLTAVGLSGLILAAMTLLLGAPYALGWDPSHVSVGPASYCRELLSQYPWAGSCVLAFQHAVLVDNLTFRLVPGAIGLLVMGGLWLLSRRRPSRPLLLPAGPAAWVLVIGGVVVATSLATGQYPGIGLHLAGTISALTVIAVCLASLRAGSRRPVARASR